MTDETHPAGEIARLEAYLARRRKSSQTDYEDIHGYDAGCATEAVLLASDIEALIAALTRANAATAAAYEVAAGAAIRIDGMPHNRISRAIRALATSAQTAALDRLIAEAVGPYVALLKRWQGLGCPNCNGDCSHANPPIYSCIMQETHTAILAASKKGGA